MKIIKLQHYQIDCLLVHILIVIATNVLNFKLLAIIIVDL